MLTVLIDCDGVLADVHKSCLDLVFRHTGQRLEKSDITHWDLFASKGMQNFDKRKFLLDVERGTFVRNIEPFPGAIDAVSKIRELVKVNVVTAPLLYDDGTIVGRWIEERSWWLIEHFGLNAKNVTFATDKSLIVGDIFIDDKPANIEMWKAKFPKKTAVLWKASYNVTNTCGADYFTNDWRFVTDLVGSLCG